MKNRFNTLNEALESEGLLDAWDSITFQPINYGQTFGWTWQDGSRHGRYVTVTRFEDGTYERPVHYKR